MVFMHSMGKEAAETRLFTAVGGYRLKDGKGNIGSREVLGVADFDKVTESGKLMSKTFVNKDFILPLKRQNQYPG
jgi:hypothetical protein